jgi:HEAT repeat protein
MKLILTRPFSYSHLKNMERDEDVPGLISALDSQRVKRSPWRRSFIMSCLEGIQAQGATSAISEVLKSDPDEMVRSSAAKALGEIGDSYALPDLRSALDDPSEKVQMWTIRSLGLMRDRESVEELISKLDDSTWGIRGYAAHALGDIGDERAIEPLARRLGDKNSTVRSSAERALAQITKAD